MYNLVYLIGRLTTDPDITTTTTKKEVLSINLAVQRSYKNSDGVYETDFIKCVLWEGIAKRVSEYCKKGDLIAVRGQIRTNKVETEEDTKYYTEILVEKVSFLSSKKEKEDK